MKKYPASTIANYFLDKAHEQGEQLSPLKLLKLVYFAYGWCLAILDCALIDEPVVAWQYGPVISSLYHQFKKFGNDVITEPAPRDVVAEKELKQDDLTLALLDQIWNVYGKYTAIQLSNLTHESNSPWDVVWHKQGGKHRYNYPINDEIIREFFVQQKAENK